ncbi:MAG: bifunctional phosphoribosylaminoimidazolecarboxamide formyltransferase/IMP cyclohydrolase [Treponema sp.]|jgi:phosphoribosylaminoimidazolecarboxamide formyltransferase/IMP cyclohydrolase|nr:bifunctional phosphoribosylaminoimidazolecarboxamide formyltransferase/IMP cyclohydrolase [Treponema sp.]
MSETKRALISVFDKNGIADLASFLHGAGWEIISTGGTAKYLAEIGIAVTDVSAVTGFPECLDGRVKTLHPAIHAALLARRDLASHRETLKALALGTIDLVCVNLYPFFEKVRAGLSLDETVEFIDIGGPAMLRSAAKNFRDVAALTDPADYAEFIACLSGGGTVPPDFRKRLAAKVFSLTAAYDAAIARFLLEHDAESGAKADPFPAFWPLSLRKGPHLRYGENNHQNAALYLNTDRPGALAGMEQLHGKEAGYNNIRDLDLAWKALCSFGFPAERPAGSAEPDSRAPLGEDDVRRLLPDQEEETQRVCCVAVKHNTPCGIALGPDADTAFLKAYTCDPVSIFGGIVAFNTTVDRAAAEKLAGLFLEIVAAPGFTPEALETLKKKKNLRIIKAVSAPRETMECVSVDGGLLVQENDRKLFEKWEVVTAAPVERADIADMIFGMRAASRVKSNAIVVVKNRAALGIGGGQTNRIWAAEQALARCAATISACGKSGAGDGIPARVLASDAFFPFADVVESAAAAGIKAIIQPGGSVRDAESIAACDRHGIAMVFTGTRHFKH